MVNHSNPVWTQKETELLLEHYKTKEMYELEKIMAGCEFPRPPEGIKMRLEKLLAAGELLDEKRIEYLRKRKFWRKEAYIKHNYQNSVWRKNNPLYSKRWFAENPGYLKNWLLAHPGYSETAAIRFLENHPDYYKNRRRQEKVCFIDICAGSYP